MARRLLALTAGNVMRANLAAAFDKREHGFLADASGSKVLAFAGVLVLLFAADERFVNLNNLSFTAQEIRIGFAQRLTDTMTKKPSCFLGQAEHTADLKGAHSLLGGHHQMRGGEPLMQRNLGALV
jgi:hypothetical protein